MDNKSQFFGFASSLSLDSFSSWSKVPPAAEYITLSLDSPGTSSLYGSNSAGTKRKWGDINGAEIPSSLALGLGRSPSSSDNSRVSSATACTMSSAKETADDESSVDLGLNFELHLGSDNTFIPKKPLKASETGATFDLELSLSTGPTVSVLTNISPASDRNQNGLGASLMISPVPSADEEGEMSSQWELATQQKIPAKADSVTSTMTIGPVACTSGFTHPQQQRNTSMKTCQFQGCGKGARGASGLCISHGGGRRCQKAGCRKGAEGRTIYCKAHGGGRRCEHLGCTKSAEGRTDYCITHGGGRRCSHEGCARAARGRSGLCIKHGGGKRCQMEDCMKSAEGYSGLCISHGGGRRCQFPECTKGAQGSTPFCKGHGGGKRCTVSGCNKGAEGSTAFCKGHGGGKRCSFRGRDVCPKSVHGGTLFCVAHGGGKRCAVADCTKSARGRTEFCVRHGGGKRCRSEGCGKSAQGSTDFCKAHGGGKRCSWGREEATPCERFARGKSGLCAAHGALVRDSCVHGGGTLGPPTTQFSTAPIEPDQFREDSMQPVIPLWSGLVSSPEGRVHGASRLMAMLSSGAGVEDQMMEAGGEEQVVLCRTVHRWM